MAGFTTKSFGTPDTHLSDPVLTIVGEFCASGWTKALYQKRLEEQALTIVPLQIDSELAEEIGDGGVAALFGNRERGLSVIGLGVKIGAMVEE